MKYIYLTLDAIDYFASRRQYQNIDFDEGLSLARVLDGDNNDWKDQNVLLHQSANGVVLYTNNINRKQGVILDSNFIDGLIDQSPAKRITIFQKVIKCSIRYFNNLAYAPCEKLTIDGNTIIVYPFPFTATKNVFKVLVDKNNSKFNRESRDILTVFDAGEDVEHSKPSYTNLKKAINTLADISTIDAINDSKQMVIDGFISTELDNVNLTIDSNIGYGKWSEYLTNTQRQFIKKPVNGVVRLAGAAGTGKTLSMILKCIYLLKESVDNKIIFVTHSKATRDHIEQIFISNWPESKNLLCDTENLSKPLLVTTLQEWCIKFLGVYLSDTEYLDKDAQDSKILQTLYIEQAYSTVKGKHWSTYKAVCSKKFVEYIECSDSSVLIDMIQYEIATIIKGRADGNVEKYQQLDRQIYSIPCENEYDRFFLFLVYTEYQQSLEKIGQYDSDDIILTALGQLNTPIWKRRRNKEGFNICCIDETHLFNINELSIFHYLNREDNKNNIIFAIDKSQHIGERGILDNTMYEILKVDKKTKTDNNYAVVFRSSANIVNLAYNVLSSAATAFQHFENPLVESDVVMSHKEELKCIVPEYKLVTSDDEFVSLAFEKADKYAKKHNVSKSNILIAATSDELLDHSERYAKNTNKHCSILKSLGDAESVNKAKLNKGYVMAHVDYVAGLEFEYVIIIGVDGSRVPPREVHDSFHFINYAWHNRMYVAITRAKYAITLLGNKNYGASPIFESALSLNLLDEC